MKFCNFKNVSLFGFFLFGFSSFGQEHMWTLEECVSYALEHNIDVQKQAIEEERANIGKQIAFGNFLPSVNGSASHSWTLGLNQNITTGLLENQTTQFTAAGVDVGIDLFKGLQYQHQLAKARLSEIAARYQAQKMKEDISLNVVNAYLQIVFNQELLKTNQAQSIEKKKQEQRAKELVQAGIVPAGDLLDVQAAVLQVEQQVISSENALELSKLALAQLLQLRNYDKFEISDSEIEVDLSAVLLESSSEVVRRAKETQIDLKIAQTRVGMADRDLKISKAQFLPQLRAFYSFATRAAYMDRISGMTIDSANPTKMIGQVEGTNQAVVQPNLVPIISGPESMLNQFDANKGQSFGLGLTIPIFNGFSVRNNVRLNRLEVKRAALDQEAAELKLEQLVYTAYADTKSALKSYEAAKVTLTARSLALEYAKARYEVGLMNVFDYNQAETLHVTAASDLLKAKYDYVFKTKILEYYFGIPLFEN